MYLQGSYPLTGVGQGPRALFNSGTAAIARSDFVTAALANRSSLSANPDDPDALNNLGWSLAKLGFYAEAVKAFQRAVELRPDYDLAANNLAWARSELQKRGTVPAPGT